MAFTNDQVRAYIEAVYAGGGTNADVAAAMDQFNVSPAQVASAFSDVPGISTQAIQSAYAAERPTGMFAPMVGPVLPAGSAATPAQPSNITINPAAVTSNIEQPTQPTATPDPGLMNATVENQPRSSKPTGKIDADKVAYVEQQLKDQYNALNQYSGYEYQGKKSDLDRFFKAQASKLAANGIGDLADIGEQDGKLINKVTGENLKKITFSGNTWLEPNSTDFSVGKDLTLEEHKGYQRWGSDYSVDGQADYAINFVDGQAVMVPMWKDTTSKWVELVAPVAAIGLNFAFPGIGAAIGGALAPGASVAVQAAIGSAAVAGLTTGVVTGDMDKALIAAALAGGGSYLNASGTLGEVFDTLGLENLKEPLGVLGGQPMSDAAFIAQDALQLAEQGLGTAAIQQNLIAAGVDPTLAASAANLASTGATLGQLTNDLKGFEGTAGLFTGGTPEDLAFGGITVGGTPSNITLNGGAGGSGISLGDFAGSETGITPGAGGETGILPGAGGETGITPTEVGAGAGAGAGMLGGAGESVLGGAGAGALGGAGSDILEAGKDVLGSLGGASSLLQGLLGAGIDYATAQAIATEASKLGETAESTAIAAGEAANVPFIPYTVTAGEGTTKFGVDPITGRPTATVTASPEYEALRQQALTQAGTTLGAINPANAAQSLFNRAEALAGPARQRESEQLLSSLGARLSLIHI